MDSDITERARPPDETGSSAPTTPPIDNMKFHRHLGHGGFGDAWLAEDSGQRRCVVKVLYPHASDIELNAYRTYKDLCDADEDGLVPVGNMLIQQIVQFV